jgi:hypothetical protein
MDHNMILNRESGFVFVLPWDKDYFFDGVFKEDTCRTDVDTQDKLQFSFNFTVV